MAALCCLTVFHFSPFSSNSQLDLSHLLTQTWLSPQCKACPIDFPVKLLLPWPQTYCAPAVPQKPHGICRPSPSLPQFSCPLPTWLLSWRQEVLKPFPFQHPTFDLLSKATHSNPSRRRLSADFMPGFAWAFCVWPRHDKKPHTIFSVKFTLLHCFLIICLQSCALTPELQFFEQGLWITVYGLIVSTQCFIIKWKR